MSEVNPVNFNDIPVYDLLQRIKNNLLDPRLLFKATRQACVETLILEGCNHSLIASLLKKSDRTIRRDICEIRKRNSIKASPELTSELLGDFLVNARHSYTYLKQTARSSNASPKEKAQAEFSAWKVLREMIQTLYVVGLIDRCNSYLQVGGIEDKKDKSSVSEREKELKMTYEQLPPIEREKLADKLYKEILAIADEKIAEEETKEKEENEKKQKSKG